LLLRRGGRGGRQEQGKNAGGGCNAHGCLAPDVGWRRSGRKGQYGGESPRKAPAPLRRYGATRGRGGEVIVGVLARAAASKMSDPKPTTAATVPRSRAFLSPGWSPQVASGAGPLDGVELLAVAAISRRRSASGEGAAACSVVAQPLRPRAKARR